MLSSILALIPAQDAAAAPADFTVTCQYSEVGNMQLVLIRALDKDGNEAVKLSRQGNIPTPCKFGGLALIGSNSYTGSFTEEQFYRFRAQVADRFGQEPDDFPAPTIPLYSLKCTTTSSSGILSNIMLLELRNSDGDKVELPPITHQGNRSCSDLASVIGVASANNQINAYVNDTQLAMLLDYITDPSSPGGPNSPGDSSGGGGGTECNLGVFGWAICPLISGTDTMLGSLYSWIEENFLQIPLGFYNTNSGTYSAWAIFRNIANVLFVIAFLVVILSQVTNLGINNYGIKKMLPELIMAVLLINLSFFIAQTMVDLSNIVGSQIKSLLEGIASTVGGGRSLEFPTGTDSLLNGLAGILIAGASVSLISTVLTGGIGALFGAVILFLVAALIAILILFLLLIVRQVGVIIFIVLAPIAFAARILPNTTNLFRSWWKSFVTLLVVYPVCGLVISAGKLAGVIIIQAAGVTDITSNSSAVSTALFTFGSIAGPGFLGPLSHFGAVGGNVYAVVAMMAMIAPYFAVITIIKGSLSGLGKIGGAITGQLGGAGSGIMNSANKGVANSGLKNLNYGSRGHTARVNARADIAKKKAEQAAINKAAKGTGVYGRMQKQDIKTAQAMEAAEMANLGQYQGDDKKLQKISAKRAKEIGVDSKTGLATEEAKNAVQLELQARAKSARNQADARAAKAAAEGFEGRSAKDIYGAVYDSGTGRLKTNDQISVEQAIAQMENKGEWEMSGKLQDAYMNNEAWREDARGRGRLGQILKNKDSKDQNFARNAYGHALAEKNFQGTFNDFMSDLRTKDDGGQGIRQAIDTGKYRSSFGTMHGDSMKELLQHDINGTIRQEIAKQMNLQSVGQMGEKNLNDFMSGNANVQAEIQSALGHITRDFIAAGQNAATLGYTDDMKQALHIPTNVTGGQPTRRDQNGNRVTDSGITLTGR